MSHCFDKANFPVTAIMPWKASRLIALIMLTCQPSHANTAESSRKSAFGEKAP